MTSNNKEDERNLQLKNANIIIIESTLLKESGDLEIYLIRYRNTRRFKDKYYPCGKNCEGIMVLCNGVYGLGKTVRNAKRNFLRKIGFS